MAIETYNFNKLNNGELAQLYAATRREYIRQRDGIEESDAKRPKTAGQSKAHIVNGAVCECPEGLASHYPQDEGQKYIHPQGYVATAEPGEQVELTEEARKIRFYESMPDSDVSRLPEADQLALLEWREARIEQICAEFVQKQRRYHPVSENKVALVDYLSRKYLAVRCQDEDEVEPTLLVLLQRGVLTPENLAEAFDALHKAGRLEARPGVAKPLNADDLRRLSALAGSCRGDRDYETVLQEYLHLSGIKLSWREAVLDSVYSPVVEKAVIWIWEQAQDTYTPTPERRAAIHKYLAGRFPTVKLLNATWLAVQRQEEREGLGQEEQPAPKLSPDEEKLQQAQALADAIAQESFRGF